MANTQSDDKVNTNVTFLVFWWAMPTLRQIQDFSDRAMQIFSAIDPNLAYSPDADPRRYRNLAYSVSVLAGDIPTH
ncbi:hypothetical protein [Coleofasciculus sp. E1-EBD-02]|uniref:hypothetical protein n=1 Tax=Coleofasciculus sp. E1-EBD-02 TaxID=3068481 RepID=UPI0032F5C508